MAKENIPKFYEALARDKALAEKLAAADKAYAETHELPAADADEKTQLAFHRKATKEIILPIAAEAGFPFTAEELETYEREQVANMEISDDELEQVAGGGVKLAWGWGHHVCKGQGAGFGTSKPNSEESVDVCGISGGNVSADSKTNPNFTASYCRILGIHWS